MSKFYSNEALKISLKTMSFNETLMDLNSTVSCVFSAPKEIY